MGIGEESCLPARHFHIILLIRVELRSPFLLFWVVFDRFFGYGRKHILIAFQTTSPAFTSAVFQDNVIYNFIKVSLLNSGVSISKQRKTHKFINFIFSSNSYIYV